MSIISGNSFGVESLSTTIRVSGDGTRVVGILLEVWGTYRLLFNDATGADDTHGFYHSRLLC